MNFSHQYVPQAFIQNLITFILHKTEMNSQLVSQTITFKQQQKGKKIAISHNDNKKKTSTTTNVIKKLFKK